MVFTWHRGSSLVTVGGQNLGVESSIVPDVLTLGGLEGREVDKSLWVFLIRAFLGVCVCVWFRGNLHHLVSCILSIRAPPQKKKLCLFSLVLTRRSCADLEVYWFPYKGTTRSTAEASVECLLVFFCFFSLLFFFQTMNRDSGICESPLCTAVRACECVWLWEIRFREE